MSTVSIFERAYETMQRQFPSSVVACVNGMDNFDAIKTRISQESLVDPMTGRVDPDKFMLRCLVSQAGELIRGRTIRVGNDDATIETVEPDSIGVTAMLTMKRRRIAGQ